MILSAIDGFLGWSGMTPGKPAGPLGDPNSPLGIATTLTGVRRFVKGDEEKVSRFVGDFYDLKREVTQWTTAMNDARLAGDMARANEIASERSDLFSLKRQVDKASRDVGEISRRMRAIQNNPNMDPQEKADALVPLRQRRNEITGRIMELAVDRGVR
jgi:phage host-nuclease inhibitor protein Gam